MLTCACCGRRLPWLHRLLGAAPYCSGKCAREHREKLRARAGQQSDVDAPTPLQGADPSKDFDPAGAGGLMEGQTDTGGIDHVSAQIPPDAGHDPGAPRAGAGERLAAAVSEESVADEPAPEPAGYLSTPGQGDLFDPVPDWPQPGVVPLDAAPACPPLVLFSRSAPFRPRRRVVVPAHRPAPPASRLLMAGMVPAPEWEDPAGGDREIGSIGSRSPGGPHESAPGSRDTLSAATAKGSLSVLVLSFEPGARQDPGMTDAMAVSAGDAGGVRSRVMHPGLEPVLDVNPPPCIPVWRGRPAHAGHRAPVRRLAAPRPALAPSAAVLVSFCATPALLNEQSSAVQPFRLHRMPLRRLSIGPRRADKGLRPAPLVSLSTLALAPPLLAPKPVSTPLRPGYRFGPASDAIARSPGIGLPVAQVPGGTFGG